MNHHYLQFLMLTEYEKPPIFIFKAMNVQNVIWQRPQYFLYVVIGILLTYLARLFRHERNKVWDMKFMD